VFSDFLAGERETDMPPHHPPSPRMLSAWTAVMRRRFSRSERLAESWASWEWRWERWRGLLEERVEVAVLLWLVVLVECDWRGGAWWCGVREVGAGLWDMVEVVIGEGCEVLG